MKLPDRIPKLLRDMAISFPEFGEGEGAWSQADAIEVIQSLKGTTVAVSEVTAFDEAPWGYVRSIIGLSVDRIANEADADYAVRSREAPAEFIGRTRIIVRNRLFALIFPMWKDAA